MTSTPTSPLPALDLRCREAEWIDRPETLAEFERPAPKSSLQRYTSLAEDLVADVSVRKHFGLSELAPGRVIVSCELPRYGIPLGVRDLEHPPILDWAPRERITADLLDVGAHGRLERSLATQVRRGLIAVAGALPLLVAPMLAQASELGAMTGLGAGIEQLASFAPPTLPKDQAPDPAPKPTEGEPAAPPTAAPPTAAPPPAPRMGGDSLTLTGTSLWDGLLDKQVKLDMKNGESVAGTIVAQSSSDLAVARAPDGVVVSVPKAEVGGVRVRVDAGVPGRADLPPGSRPLEDGRGLHGGGIVMVSIGAIAGLAGTVMLAIYPYGLYISLPLLLPGLAMIGGGSAMLSKAGKKRKAFNEAWGIPNHAKVQVIPTIGAGRSGGQAGLILKF